MRITVQWNRNFRFSANDQDGHEVEMDATQMDGKMRGITPMQLLLIALGGCTGIDVVQILEKQRQQITGLDIIVSGDRKADPPRYFEKIRIEYVLTGQELDDSKVQRAIRLSEEKYCSVGAMLNSRAKITSSYVIMKE